MCPVFFIYLNGSVNRFAGQFFCPTMFCGFAAKIRFFIPHTAKATAVFLFLSLLRGMKNAVPAKRNQAKISLPFHRRF